MFNTYEHNGMVPVVVIVWDVSTTSHGTVGWDGHLGLGVLCMGQLGMDTWDWGVVHGTAWDSQSVSITSHGTVGWDGHLGLGCCAWDSLGFPQCVHYFPWYSGMGWTRTDPIIVSVIAALLLTKNLCIS